MNIKPLFFTFPPESIPHGYVLINANSWRRQLNYIRSHRDVIEMIIIDSGIEIFRDRNTRDYPGGYKAQVYRLVRIYNVVRSIVPKAFILATCPDYPDDYWPKQCWVSEDVTNVERTLESIRFALERFPKIPWLIPIQGHHRDPLSIKMAIHDLVDDGLLENRNYVAVANLCTENTASVIYDTLKIARDLLPSHWIHAFGINLRTLNRVKDLIDSFDSTAWTRPVSTKILNANWSAKNEYERLFFFLAWYFRYLEIIGGE